MISFIITGRRPRGCGVWKFEIAGRVHTLTGMYGQCKKQARRQAEIDGATEIRVLP